ncbi:flavin reductase family protein [Ancylobacter mangrovi]|uniref:flavin reductase family protein n=1 Tax=Ancylobacter mangrovi TaxID=2972472 RepID=UPI002161FD80|nr:flavin reductase [Ancylobacter mangrovi]MCS0501085.1 flavin reductase [Ancylobacter mangrovi]
MSRPQLVPSRGLDRGTLRRLGLSRRATLKIRQESDAAQERISPRRDEPQLYPLSLDHVARMLQPRPAALLIAGRSRTHISFLGWHALSQADPPLISCAVAPADPTYAAVRASGECVIAIPTLDMTPAVTAIATGMAGQEPFSRFSFTSQPASLIGAPLICECLLNLECRISSMRLVNCDGLFVMEVVAAWYRPELDPGRALRHLRSWLPAGE